MKNHLKLFLIFMVFTMTGCGESDRAMEPPSLMDFSPASSEVADQKGRNPYLAYEHSVSIEVEEENLEASFQNTLKKCSDDSEHACEIHYSDLRTGDYPSADIRVRIKKKGVAGFIQTAAGNNKISGQSVSAEDLATPILDNEKRLKMLGSYQKRLTELESQSAKDIDSLIKVASEIARVQSDLEAAKGENEHLLKRINMDIVSIHFHTDPADSILEPICDALKSFAHNLSKGIAGAITAVAYLLPWIIILLGLYFVVRWLWRKRKQY